MSLTLDLINFSISSVFISGPLTSPAITTVFVVTKVSQATLLSGNLDKYKSSTESDIISQTLSGCPSDTDSLVNI